MARIMKTAVDAMVERYGEPTVYCGGLQTVSHTWRSKGNRSYFGKQRWGDIPDRGESMCKGPRMFELLKRGQVGLKADRCLQ